MTVQMCELITSSSSMMPDYSINVNQLETLDNFQLNSSAFTVSKNSIIFCTRYATVFIFIFDIIWVFFQVTLISQISV